MRDSGRGFTLVEILLVIAILGVVAAVATPMFSSGDPQKLRTAAHAVANAMRYARQESIRTGTPHVFGIYLDLKRIRVYRADTTVSPWTGIYDVYDPLTRQLYEIYLETPAYGSVNSATGSFTYQGACQAPSRVAFDAAGTPLCFRDETSTLMEYQLTLSIGASSRQVTLSGHTGRVTIQ